MRNTFTLLILGVLLVGCGKSGSKIDQASLNGIFHFGNGTEIQDLDHQVVTGVPEHKVVMSLIEGLVMEDPVDLSPEPGVAERWEVSDDGLDLYLPPARQCALDQRRSCHGGGLLPVLQAHPHAVAGFRIRQHGL